MIVSGNYRSFKTHVEQYISLTEMEFQEVLSYFSEISVEKNESLIKEGSRVINTFYIINGLAMSVFIDEKGKERIIQFANENCWITDQEAFYNQVNSSFNIICIEKTQLLCLSYQNRERLCKEVKNMETFFRKKANESFVKQQQRLLTYMTMDVKARYELLPNLYPNLLQRVPKKLLAAYLGVSRETLSRLKKTI